jgi:hypothetical protein
LQLSRFPEQPSRGGDTSIARELLAATAPSKICLIPERVFAVEGVGMDVIQAPELEPRIMV